MISTIPLNTQVPCPRPDHERLIKGGDSWQGSEFIFERESPLKACPDFPWRHTNSDKLRHQKIFSTNLFNMQEANGIFGEIRSKQPEIYEKIDLPSRKLIELDWMIRRRYRWSLECDQASFESFFKTVEEMRPYFYSQSEIDRFPDIIFGHSHDEIQSAS